MNDLDYDKIDSTLNGKKYIKYADVQHRIQKVAFDVVRFTDNSGGFDKLWIVKEENGEKVLVAMYDEEEPITAKASIPWAAHADSFGNVNVFYKGEPITKFAVTKLGLKKEDAGTVCSTLPAKLAGDKSYVGSMLSMLNYDERTDVYSKYPELK